MFFMEDEEFPQSPSKIVLVRGRSSLVMNSLENYRSTPEIRVSGYFCCSRWPCPVFDTQKQSLRN